MSGGVPTIVGTVSTGGDTAAASASSVTRITGWEALDVSTSVNNTATSAIGERLLTLTGDQGVLTSFGRDTIQADAGTGVVYAAGAKATIHALWVALADRAGQDDEPDVKAAAALAGMAMGLRAG